MKRALFTILAAVACGSFTASAVDATSVQVSLESKGGGVKIDKIAMPQNMSFGEANMSAKQPIGWQLVNIPVTVEGRTKTGDSPHFVPSIKFTAYLLIDSDTNKGKPVLLSKEITYVDIPLSGGGETTKNEMYVGVFIPPSSALRIQEKTKGDLKGKLLGLALDAEFNGKRCMKKGESLSAVYDKSIKKNLSDDWWTKSMGDSGAVLCSIDQTPYAAWGSGVYPQVAPAQDPMSSTIPPSSPTPLPSDDTSSDTSADTDSSDTDTAAEEEEETTSKSKKKKRSKRSRR